MTDRFNNFVQFILKAECDWPNDTSGQFSDDPDDPGGATKFGIDARSYYKDNPGSSVKIKDITVTDAISVYWQDYWLAHGIEAIPYPLGEMVLDCFVNGGHPTDWLAAVKGISDPAAAARAFLNLRIKYYHDLCAYWQAHGKNNPYKYLPGWLNRCADLKAWLKL